MTAFEHPIIILGSPRSGTSLTAQIFQAHGVWVGTSKDPDQWNPRGYCESNILYVPRLMAGHGDGLDPGLVYDLITVDGYVDGPWLVKHSPLTWRAWRQFSPYWVLVRRDPEAILRSRVDSGLWQMTESEHRVAVETDIAILKGIKQHIGGVEVWPERLLRAPDHIGEALSYCGIEMNRDKVKSCIDPSLWHQHEELTHG